MRRAVIFVALVVGLVGCAGPQVVVGTPGAVAGDGGSSGAVTPTSVGPPASPEPVRDGACPYLEKAFVEDANGQRVGKVRVSVDEPNPACFFYRSDGRVQLTTQVYVGDEGVAKALVDRAAPVDTANPAELPAGWTGGSQSTDAGAVFAVAKGGAAVVITTNQAQTIKAKRVAEKTIAALGL
ncbi:MAG TPA: DUF2020 domain-containing protein [Actinophytocola sp.]|uniref:DUF2020 domain-containing protein n=1 Tax=Actinophytocola sp. TaxID=1872138 RepID=UPI002DC00407|nr:DUF2020 domain-containing protein [Actinophytocola sp.]HEU5473141.1 DUF2020 domain-containing protein [Actinophytocola sp.]